MLRVQILAVCMTVCVVYCRSCWRRLGSCSQWITHAACADPRGVYDSVCCVLQELLKEAWVMF